MALTIVTVINAPPRASAGINAAPPPLISVIPAQTDNHRPLWGGVAVL
ncbi:hypothetical protein ACSPJ8_002481 [Klebsiella aerogenes]